MSLEEIEIREQMIRLGQLLKLTGVIDSGSEVRDFLAADAVLVNGEPESRRGRQLHNGDVVSADGRELRVLAPEASEPRQGHRHTTPAPKPRRTDVPRLD